MARIRAVNYRLTGKNNLPKIAFFHNNNFDDFIKSFPIQPRVGNVFELVNLNDDQTKKTNFTIANKLNNKVFRFHR